MAKETSLCQREGAPHTRVEVLVDGFNLLHAVILKGRERRHWWSKENQQRVVSLLDDLDEHLLEAALREREFVDGALTMHVRVVFDSKGSQNPPQRSGRTAVHLAPDADDWLVERAIAENDALVLIVSADRALQDRAGNFGAHRMSPWSFAKLCSKQ